MQLKLISLFILISFFCCKENKTDYQEIYALVINKNVKPFPPPPPNFDVSEKIAKHVLDSLNNVSIKVAVNTQSIKFEFYEYQEFIHNNEISETDLIFKNQKYLPKEYFEARPSIKFNFIVNKVPDFEKILEKNDYVLQFSNIVFNITHDKAFLIVIYSSGKMSGSEKIYYLEKVEKKWKIKNSKTLSFS